MRTHKRQRVDDNELHDLILRYNTHSSTMQDENRLYALCSQLADAILARTILQDKQYVKQDAIIKVFNNLHKYNSNKKQCVNYIYTIIHRYVLDQMRRQNTRKRHIDYVGKASSLDVIIGNMIRNKL